jgi:hypothetical protein
LRELTDAVLEQHKAARSTLVWIRENSGPLCSSLAKSRPEG